MRKTLLGVLALAIFAAAQYSPPAGGGVSSGVTQIAQTVLGAPAASIVFSSVPATYTNLVITLTGRGSGATNTVNATLQFNADTGANYNWIYISQNNASGSNFAQTAAVVGIFTAASATANFPASTSVRVYNYAGTTFIKQFTAQNTLQTAAGSGLDTATLSGDWSNTAAIATVTLAPASGNFITGTTATLYGEK